MALPTQTDANKAGMVPFQLTDSDGIVHNTMGGAYITFGTGTPNATVTAPIGSLFIDVTNANLYMNTDASTTWELVSAQT